jgi:hypothetical protein
MQNNNSNIVSTTSPVPALPTVTEPASVSADEIRDASIEKLNALYRDCVTKSASLVQSMIGVGECVVEIINTCVAPSGVFSNPKQGWKLLEVSGNVPFGWVQALRYKKIYEQRDALQAKFQELGINLTVEKAYRLLGGPDEKAEPTKKNEGAPFVGTVFGVDSQMLVKRRSELAHDIEVSKGELTQLVEKLKGLEELDSAYTYVQSFLAQPDALVRTSTLTPKIAHPFSMVSKENEAVHGFYKLLQMCFYSDTGTAADTSTTMRAASIFSKRECKDYRAWLLRTFADDQPKLLTKLQAFLYNSDKAIAEDPDFAAYQAEQGKVDEAIKQKIEAEQKAYRYAQKVAAFSATMGVKKNHSLQMSPA